MLAPGGVRRVVIVQRIMPHYRVVFFDRLCDFLAERSISLEVIYGQHVAGAVPQSVFPDRSWAKFVANRYFSLLGRQLVWQYSLNCTRGASLVILEHAARLLGNYPILARCSRGNSRVAFWGHGASFQATHPDSLSERLKRKLLNRVDWWFAYTQRSELAVAEAGFSPDRITVVQNAIDDIELREGMRLVSSEEAQSLRKELRIEGKCVAIYCGGLYKEKKLDFLLAACQRVRSLLPDFEMIFIGSGPEQNVVEAAAERYDWIRYVGPVYGAGRAKYFALSQLFLMPGPVGLAVVDSFVAGVPLVTTEIPEHGPEIAYLKHGVNGVISGFNVEEYARVIVDCFNSPANIMGLRQGCLESSDVYTLDNMVRNFGNGIISCLEAGHR